MTTIYITDTTGDTGIDGRIEVPDYDAAKTYIQAKCGYFCEEWDDDGDVCYARDEYENEYLAKREV